MKYKVISGIMLTLFFMSMLTLAFDIQPVEAHPRTWTVDDDGPADFHTIREAINAASLGDTIFVRAGTYHEHVTINNSISLVGENRETTIIDGNGTGIVITITVEKTFVCNFTVQNAGYGFIVRHSDSNYILNNTIISNERGIELQSSKNNTISSNTIKDNIDGIYLDASSENNTIRENMLANMYGGINIGGNSNTLIKNIVLNNGTRPPGNYGIYLWSHNNILIDNNMTGNDENFGVFGARLHDFIHDIDASNLVNEKPIYYWVNQHDKQIPLDAGYVAVVNSTNITVKDIELSKNTQGILFVHINNSCIENVVASSNWIGLELYYSNSNIITGNNLTANNCGIILEYSSDNDIYHNNFVCNFVCIPAFAEESYDNVWDNSYPSGGNYWSTYTGLDSYSGSCQNVTGSDGIGDTPYVIGENNEDNYPLMEPWSPQPSILGDLNNDGSVDISDIIIAGKAFASCPGHLRWDYRADINSDDVVDIFDLILIAINFGKTI